MNPRWKKAVVVVLKVAILCGIVEYARRQSQLGDEIAVSHGARGRLERRRRAQHRGRRRSAAQGSSS